MTLFQNKPKVVLKVVHCIRKPVGEARKSDLILGSTGCVRLQKSDDTKVLTKMECFARSELVEVFSYNDKETLDGYCGPHNPSDGQVGIRCTFCKSVDSSDRMDVCVRFPDSLSQIRTKVTAMIKRHFPSCTGMPRDVANTFKRLYEIDETIDNENVEQYWIDAARDIGLCSRLMEGWRPTGLRGIVFYRDPSEPSPADEFDLDYSVGNGNIVEAECSSSSNPLVRHEDKGLCTDDVMFVLLHAQPCRFRSMDRRYGRDNPIGFPGFCCMYCDEHNKEECVAMPFE